MLKHAFDLLQSLSSQPTRGKRTHRQNPESRPLGRRLHSEELEDRVLLSITSIDDATVGSLLTDPAETVVSSDVQLLQTQSLSVEPLAAATSSMLAEPQLQTGAVWMTSDEVMRLPTSGAAWDSLSSAARNSTSNPNISDQNDKTNVYTLAKAMVGLRTGNQQYINEVRATIMKAMGTEDGGRTLALGRNLAAYVIAADLVGLDSSQDAQFRDWLRGLLTENLSGRTLQSTHEDRPNNWGTMAGASRAAVAVYLGDDAELARTAKVFKGYLGDRASYADFKYGELSWQADASKPVGINPKGAMKDGHSIDGVMPDDMRRGGSFRFPPSGTGYPWEGLQGAVVQAEILFRAGYDAWQWEDQALLRAVNFLDGLGWDAEGDDEWQISLINARYGTNFSENLKASPGKLMGWTAWSHQNAPAAMTAQVSLAAISFDAVSPEVQSASSVETGTADMLKTTSQKEVASTTLSDAAIASIVDESGSVSTVLDYSLLTEEGLESSSEEDNSLRSVDNALLTDLALGLLD